jgi:hypothetical protein
MHQRRILALFAPILATCAIAVAAHHDKAEHPDTTDWAPLFKDDLSNAIKPEGVWTAEEGVFTASEDQAMWSDRDYDNFILDLEFKMGEGANSGVAVYCSNMDDWIPNSLEIQVQDDFADKWKDGPENWRCGGVFGHLAPTKQAGKPAGEWNHYTITCKDSQVDVILNGEHVASMDMTKYTSAKKNPDGSDVPAWLSKPAAELPTKGRIGFQGKHAGAPIWFRNIKVKELK